MGHDEVPDEGIALAAIADIELAVSGDLANRAIILVAPQQLGHAPSGTSAAVSSAERAKNADNVSMRPIGASVDVSQHATPLILGARHGC